MLLDEQNFDVQHTYKPPDLLQIKLIEETEAAESAVEHIKAFSSVAIGCEGLGGGQDDPILLFQVTLVSASQIGHTVVQPALYQMLVSR